MLAREVLRSALNAGRGSNFEPGRHLLVQEDLGRVKFLASGGMRWTHMLKQSRSVTSLCQKGHKFIGGQTQLTEN